MKRILIVADFISGSGLTGVIFDIFSRFPKDEYQVEAVGYGEDPTNFTAKKCEELGWQLYRVVPVTKSPLQHWLWWRDFFHHHSYDVVYFNYSSSWNYLPVVYAKRYGEKTEVVCHSHNAYFSHTFSNPVMMKLLTALNNHGKKVFAKIADKKVATSPEAAKWMFGKDAWDVHVVSNGRDLDLFEYSPKSRAAIRSKLKLSENTKLIGFVGVLQDRKNPLFAIKVFNEYHQQHQNSRLVMLGKGPLKQKVTSVVSKLGLSDAVMMIDFVPDVNRWYSAMDALLFPSNYEGFGLVAIEAQISNLPILTSNLLPDVVFVTESIRKMEGFDVHAWSKALAGALAGALANDLDRLQVDPKLNQFGIVAQVEAIRKIIED